MLGNNRSHCSAPILNLSRLTVLAVLGELFLEMFESL